MKCKVTVACHLNGVCVCICLNEGCEIRGPSILLC